MCCNALPRIKPSGVSCTILVQQSLKKEIVLELSFVDFPGIIFSGIELLMVVFFWFVNYYVDNNDFTKAYVTVLMVPLSASTVTKLWSVVNSVAGVSLTTASTYGDM
ncbi:hypothetical protein Y032_0032g2539 [Ancylostoma ceylanicum]|uniref:Uncharacterized protein n=1 Tax=Ancylostoma ceylanicum TaxID=53326 RepID=A0A016UQT9_9BILA|nr:hypothetical protein Y032_0032g2539 [Ancylostoma ceylanicum]